MPKCLKIIISLTCALLLCATTAHAREVLQNVPKNTLPVAQAVWQPSITKIVDWKALSKPVRDYEYSKFVYDLRSKKMYFFDVNVFTLHTDFVLDYLLKQAHTPQNIKSYNRNYASVKPQFVLGYITHYPNIKNKQNNDLWTFSFWEGDTIQAKDIRKVHADLQQKFKIAKLAFRPDSLYQERVAKQLKPHKIRVVKNDDIYKSQPFQAFNTGVAVGRLRVVPAGTKFEDLHFSPDEIVILQEAYPDISPVAGIVTSLPSTPLAHVNLRAAAWGIPNATDIYAAELYFVQQNKWVRMQVSDKSLTIVPASAQEIAAAQTKLAVPSINLPQADLNTQTLAPLAEIRASHARIYGAKTANLGELMSASQRLFVAPSLYNAEFAPRQSSLIGKLNIPDAFGIPFYYYQQFMQQYGFDTQVQQMLSQPAFLKDAVWRKQQLSELRAAIQAKPIAPQTMQAIMRLWQSQLLAQSVFVRSSTNAEDLAGFNGAGLYDTVPNVRDEKTLEAAIKQVWASLWNARAVDERIFFGIDHRQVYVAVLVQTAIDATAAGVLLTADIWANQPNTYTINAKWGLGMRVVGGQKTPEQVLYDVSNNGMRILSRSDETTMLVADKSGVLAEQKVPIGQPILTAHRTQMLGLAAMRAQQVFKNIPVLDIEWVLETRGGVDKIWLVQARPYVKK